MKNIVHVGLALLFLLSPTGCAPKEYPIEYPALVAEDELIIHEGFSVSYNHTTLCPNWVAYSMTAEKSEGKLKGKQSFQWDPLLKGRHSNREDYKNDRQWDKGHMAPKADMKWSVQAYEESFYLTNICPQNHSFNAGIWSSTEKMARRIAKQYGVVYIICGPIFTDNHYGTLGESRVVIPDKFYKALLIETGHGYSAIAFVLDNSPENLPLKENAMTVDELESIIGRNLFKALDDRSERQAESRVVWGDWGI